MGYFQRRLHNAKSRGSPPIGAPRGSLGGFSTPRGVFSVGLPGMTPVEQTGESFRSFSRNRFGDIERSGNRWKHRIPDILFVEQTESTAHAVIPLRLERHVVSQVGKDLCGGAACGC